MSRVQQTIKQLTAIEAFIAAAKVFRNVQEHGGPNAGEMVELFLKAVGLVRGQPWCAAFVSYVGYNAFRSEEDPSKSTWPMVMSGGCAVLGEFADKKAVLVTEGQRGDLFLLKLVVDGVTRFAHVGVVLSGPDAEGRYRTIEGNTNDGDGSREGFKVAMRRRTITPENGHRFVRWVSLLSPT